MIKDIAGAENWGSQPVHLTPLQGQVLYFGYNLDGTPTDSYALYRSDGTQTGTLALRAFTSAPTSEFDTELIPAVFNGGLYFAAATSSDANGVELWRSDGTGTGTALFANLYPGSSSGSPRWLTPSGQTLFFQASNSSHGAELWKTNGTLETTTLVKDIRAGSQGSYPEFLAADGAGGVYFAADDGQRAASCGIAMGQLRTRACCSTSSPGTRAAARKT